MNFKKGDVIPIDMPELVSVQAEEVSIFSGKVGLSDGNYAIQVTEKLTQDSM
jgi:flagellar motor switch protein FliM